jgi:hypothetical protein|tara:strand:+ start:191 stop:1819 length:1629 start_codon:yes stop_codon:yes gene_type:complete
MLIKNIVIIGLTASILFGCKSDTASSSSAAAVAGLNLPANIEVLQDDAAVSANLAAVNNAAYNSTGTDYTNAKAEIYIDAGEWQEPLTMGDFLICVMNGTGADLIPNGTYKALLNMTQCDNEQSSTQVGKKTSFAEATVVSSRASNTSPQLIKSYIVDTHDENNDGDTTDAGEALNIVTEVSITESASTSNPYGLFTFDWNQTNNPSGEFMRGSLAITNDSSTQVGMSMIAQSKNSSDEDNLWAKGLLNKDGSGGKMKVNMSIDENNDGDFLDSGEIVNFKINFNATHANIDTDGTVVCKNLTESSMTSYVYNYNLYNSTTGALKDITAGLEFLHGNGTSSTLRGYAGSYVNGSGAVKHWIWTEDGSAPTTIYKESDTSVSYSIAWASGQPTITGMTFDPRIEIDASFTGITPGGTSGTKTDNLDYEGPGQLWGMNWTLAGDTNSNGQCDGGESSCDNEWSPEYNIADGTSLTDTNGVVWKVKQMGMWKTLATVNASNCSTLPVTDAAVAFTIPSLSAVSTTWASKPAVTARPRVISGIKQY